MNYKPLENPYVCPVTGLPVICEPEWANQTFGSNYSSITIKVVGTNIIYTKVCGYTYLYFCKEYISLLEKVAESSLPKNEKYILIEDFSCHNGTSRTAKDYYLNYHRNNKRLLGIIFCLKSTIFRIITKIAKNILFSGFPRIEIVDGYETAVRLALQWQLHQAKHWPDTVEFYTNLPLSCPVTGLPITAPPEWTGIDLGEGYSVSFRLIGDRILQTLPAGNSGRNGMKRLLEERDKFLKTMGLWNINYVEIKDYSNVTGNTNKEGRIDFTQAMLKERDRGNLLGYWGYNASRFIKWTMNVGTKLNRTTFPIAIADSYKEAVKMAVNTLDQRDSIDRYKSFTNDEWYIELDDFKTRFKIINNDIIYIETSGKMKEEHIDKFFQLYKRVLKEMKLPYGYYFRIVNWTNFKGITWRAGKLYTDRAIELNREVRCALSAGFGLNKFMKSIIIVSRPFVSFPIVIY